MRRRIGMLRVAQLVAILCGILCGLAPAGLAASAAKATVIVINARVYTVNAKQPWAEAVAVAGDKILAMGSREKIDTFRDKNTQIIDVHGQLVLPGFTDSHFHLIEGSRTLTQVDLNGTTCIAEVQKRVKEFAAAHPDAAWIAGRGW